MRPRFVGVVLFLCTPFTVSPLLSQTKQPADEKLVFQNDYVRAYEINLKPGQKLPPHEMGNRLVYSLTPYRLNYHWGDRVSEERRKPGDVHFHPAGVHFEENSGKQPARFLMIERTATPLPQLELQGHDMAKASPFNTKVLFDRDMAKVFEVTLPPKDAVSMHLGLNRLVYALTAFDLAVQTPDGKEVREKGKKGSCAWHPAGLHAVTNRTGGTVRFLVFAFKR